MNSADYQRIQHIRRYCEDISGFIKRFGMDFTVFSTDRAYFNAVSMCVLQIGELANSLSSEYREETKDQMPWGMIRGMRNWIAHAYSEMDEETIWETVIHDIPRLSDFCERELQFFSSLSEKDTQKDSREKRKDDHER